MDIQDINIEMWIIAVTWPRYTFVAQRAYTQVVYFRVRRQNIYGWYIYFVFHNIIWPYSKLPANKIAELVSEPHLSIYCIYNNNTVSFLYCYRDTQQKYQ